MSTLVKDRVDKKVAEEELAKFFNLFGRNEQEIMPMYMPPGIVDEVWHEKIEDADKYKEFCEQTAGKLVGHKEIPGKGELKWIKAYEREFGPLNEAWFADKEGYVNQRDFNEYKTQDSISMTWRCGPILTD